MRFRVRLQRLFGIGAIGLGFLAPEAFAQNPRAPAAVEASGACPAASSVVAILSTLLPPAGANGANGANGTNAPAPRPAVTVTDRGDSYVVAVGDRAKTYPEAARDCAARARVAAAFIALVMAPPPSNPPSPVGQASASAPAAASGAVASSSASPAVAPPPSGAPPPSSPSIPGGTRVGPRGWLRLDANGALEVSNLGGVAGGLAIAVEAGRGFIGGRGSCGWLSNTTIDVGAANGSVDVERFLCSIGPVFRLVRGRDRFEANINAGLAFGVVTASGHGFAASYQASRLETGARLAIEAILHPGPGWGSFVPVLGFEATYYPMVYDLDVASRGVVAETPSFWAGLTVGAGWSPE